VQEGAAHILQNYPVKLVFVTCGADGCWYQNAVAQGHVPSLSDIQVMDTTGAGDIFGGSAVWKLLQLGKAPEVLEQAELEEVVRFACTAAGLSTTRPGGISSVPEYNEVLKRM
jgi:fructokinase